MPMPPHMVLATRNAGKVREVLAICADWPVKWLTYCDVSWPEVEEVGSTYLENARLKARAASRSLSIPALADDSGIEIEAFRGLPGPRSARYAGPSADDDSNLRLLIRNLEQVPPEKRIAHYRCIAVCVWPDSREVWAEGVCRGHLITTPRGVGGFGYDPIFVPEGLRQTMAELPAEEKNRISHRAKALRSLEEMLRKP